MNRPSNFDPLTRAILEGIELDVFEDDLGRALLETWKHKVIDDDLQEMILKRVSSARLSEALQRIPFQQPRLTNGSLHLGQSMHGQDISIPLSYTNAHTLVIANSGAGKTTRSRMLALQMAVQVHGVWLFDLRKREFRMLRPVLRELGVELHLVSARTCKINVLEPPVGVHPAAWASTAADLLVRVLKLPQRAGKLVHRSIISLQRSHGVLNGNEHHPTLFDLFEAVSNDKSANAQARHALLDALEPVLRSLGPSVLAYRKGWKTQDLAKRKIVFEFGDVTDTDKNLIINTLLIGEFTRRVASGVSNAPMDLWICCDEGQRICGGELDDLIGLVRGAGIGLDLSVLSPHGVSPQVLANTSIKVMGRCGHLGDYIDSGRCLGLSKEQVRWAQLNLNPGQFIVSTGEGAWRKPFLLNIPEPIRYENTNLQQESTPSNPMADLTVQAASEFINWPESTPVQSSGSENTEKQSLSDDERRFCLVVRDHPLLQASRYARLAKMNATKAVRVRGALLDRLIIRQHKLDTGGRGRSAMLLEMTPLGLKLLEQSIGENT